MDTTLYLVGCLAGALVVIGGPGWLLVASVRIPPVAAGRESTYA